MKPKVSVVIPFFNTEAYIEEAINSIQVQTLSELEIILVDDGSTDQSLAIVQRLAQQDKRIRVFSQSNQGVSAARNKGLELVNGEFIYFLDSDDSLEKNALALCYEKCVRDQLDFVFFDAESIHLQNNYPAQTYIHRANRENQISSGPDLLNQQLDTYTYRSPVWLNFIRADFLQQHHLSFFPGIIHEDELFTFFLYIYAKRVGYIAQIFSKRKLRHNSIMTQKFSWKNIRGYLTVTEELLKVSHTLPSEVQPTLHKYLRFMLNAVIWKAHTLSVQEKRKLFSHCVHRHYLKYITLKNLLVLFLKA